MTSVSVAAPPAAASRFHSETLAYVGLSFSTLAWASAFIAGKFALAEMTPLAVGAWRFAVAALLLAPFALRRQQRPMQTGAWAPLALMMLCGGVVYPWLFLEALAHTSATNTSLLIALNPALTLLFSPLIGERLDRQRLVGIGVALAGAVTVITRGDPAHFASLSAFNHGDLLAVLAAATWATFNLASRRAVANFAPSLINFAIYASGGTVLFALGAGESPVQQVLNATAFAVGGVLVMAVMSSVLAGQCFLVGVRTVGVEPHRGLRLSRPGSHGAALRAAARRALLHGPGGRRCRGARRRVLDESRRPCAMARRDSREPSPQRDGGESPWVEPRRLSDQSGSGGRRTTNIGGGVGKPLRAATRCGSKRNPGAAARWTSASTTTAAGGAAPARRAAMFTTGPW